MISVSVFGVTPDGRYAVVKAGSSGGYSLGFMRDSELVDCMIYQIVAQDCNLVMRRLPLNMQKAIFYMVKPMLPLVEDAPMSSEVLQGMENCELLGVTCSTYPITYREFIESDSLDNLSIDNLWSDQTMLEVMASYGTWDDSEYAMEKRNFCVERDTIWLPVDDRAISMQYDKHRPEFSRENFDKFIKDYDIVQMSWGYSVMTPIPAFLDTGSSVVRYDNPNKTAGFYLSYGLEPIEAYTGNRIRDHVCCFRSREGRVYITYQPYLRDEEIREFMDKHLKELHMIPKEYKKVKVDILGKDASWHCPGSTNLVVLHL